jgi:hypothetical protein
MAQPLYGAPFPVGNGGTNAAGGASSTGGGHMVQPLYGAPFPVGNGGAKSDGGSSNASGGADNTGGGFSALYGAAPAYGIAPPKP